MDSAKSGKIGSPARTAASVSKSLGYLAETCEASSAPAIGILAAIGKFEKLLVASGRAEGWEAVAETMVPLTKAVSMAKQTVRRRQGLRVTPSMQEDMRDIVAWHSKRCSAELVGNVYKNEDTGDHKKKVRTVADMERLERGLRRKLHVQAGPAPPRPPSSSPSAGSAVSTASPSAASSKSSYSGPSHKSARLTSFPKSTRGEAFFPQVARVSPGTAFVPAGRPTVRIDPRASHLAGSGAVRWF